MVKKVKRIFQERSLKFAPESDPWPKGVPKRIPLARLRNLVRMCCFHPVKPFAARRDHRPPSTPNEGLKSTPCGHSHRIAAPPKPVKGGVFADGAKLLKF